MVSDLPSKLSDIRGLVFQNLRNGVLVIRVLGPQSTWGALGVYPTG
jgi:hypothetical protein